MRRRVLVAGLGWGLACSAVSGEPPPQPVPTIAAAPSPEPSPPPRVEPEPGPTPTETEPEPSPPPRAELEPEPAAPPWSADDEPRILKLQPLVAEAAAEHGVDPYLVNGVIWVESKFHPKARNRSGARGLMQLMPKTAKALGRALGRPARVYDPEFNVHAGTYYLSRMLLRFEGDRTLALAAYARGPGRVRTWVDEGEPLPDGVVRFVEKVEHARAVFEALRWPSIEPEPEPDPDAEPELVGDEPTDPADASGSTPAAVSSRASRPAAPS